MKRAILILAALALLLGCAGQAPAGIAPPGGVVGDSGGGVGGSGGTGGSDPLFTFTFSDAFGDAGHGTLNATPAPGFGTNAFWATSGTLDVTSGFATGTYTLLPAGPAGTVSPTGAFIVDNLIFPSDNAASSANAPVSNPSFLDNDGLLFGPGGSNPGSQTEINIFGNGGGDYAFLGFTSSAGYSGPSTGVTFNLTAVPEPSSLVLLATAVVPLAGYFGRRRRKEAAA